MDRDLAATLAGYSALAYLPPDALRAALPDAEVEFFDRDATQAYAIRRAGHSALAFRGTQVFAGFSLADVLSNLWVRRRAWGPGKVHAGYLEALLDVVEEVKVLLYRAPRPLYFTGHSMGGALASLAATLPPGPDAAYSFGAARRQRRLRPGARPGGARGQLRRHRAALSAALRLPPRRRRLAPRGRRPARAGRRPVAPHRPPAADAGALRARRARSPRRGIPAQADDPRRVIRVRGNQ